MYPHSIFNIFKRKSYIKKHLPSLILPCRLSRCTIIHQSEEKTLFPEGRWRSSILFGEATGEVFRIVESHTIGNLGDVAIGHILHNQFLGNIQTIVTDKLRRRQSTLRIEFPALDAPVHSHRIGEFLNAKLGVIIVLLHHFHDGIHKRFGVFSHLLLIRLDGFLLTFLIALLVF